MPEMMGFEIQIRDTRTHSKGASMDGVADPRKGPGKPAPPPLFLDQTKIFSETGLHPYLRGLDDRAPL